MIASITAKITECESNCDYLIIYTQSKGTSQSVGWRGHQLFSNLQSDLGGDSKGGGGLIVPS